MRAYVAYDPHNSNDRVCTVFACGMENAMLKAKKQLHSSHVCVRHEPAFDKYAEQGSVPAKALYDEGWDMVGTCDICGRMIVYWYEAVVGLELGIQVWFDEEGNVARLVCEECLSGGIESTSRDQEHHFRWCLHGLLTERRMGS